ncbi:MAG: SH3 domain-containing protein [Leptospiraceae bacterium]|nr:SH3 domain-containing protein [Leptospiraceae bacterium]
MNKLTCDNCSGNLIQTFGDKEVWTCEYCKTKFFLPRNSNVPQRIVENQTLPVEPSKNNSKSKLRLALLITFAVVLCVGFGGYYFITQHMNSQTPKPKEDTPVSSYYYIPPSSYTPTPTQIMLLQVSSNGGLRMREEPKLTSKVVVVVPDEALVTFIKDTGIEVTAENLTGTFFEIEFDGKTGYAFSELMKYERKNGEVHGFFLVKENSNYSKYYYKALSNEPVNQGFECNQKYSTLNCFILVYTLSHKLVLDSREIPETGEYEYGSWEGDDTILLSYGWGDDGCSVESKAVLNVPTKKFTVTYNKNECHNTQH